MCLMLLIPLMNNLINMLNVVESAVLMINLVNVLSAAESADD